MIRSFNTNTRNLILRLVTIILVPAIVLTVFYNLYVFRSTYNKFADIGAEHSAALRLEMDEKLSLINSFLLSEAAGNDFATICYSDDMLQRNLSLSNIINHFTQRIQDIPEIAALFILSDSFCRDRYNSYISFGESACLKAYAMSFLTEDTQNQVRRAIAWQSCLVGEDSYLIYHYISHNVQLVCFFSLEQLYQNTLSSQYENRTCILTDSAGNILFSCPDFPFEDSLKIPDQETPYYRTTTAGRYLYAPAFSEHTD